MAMLLALGAPAGLLILQALRAHDLSPAWLGRELARDTWTYLYVTVSTVLAFSLFGYVLGSQADRLIELSNTDPLTGLGNDRFFRDRLQGELNRTARYRQPLSLLLLDLDRLKAINDSHGHRAGDAALVELGAQIAAEARVTDTCARWGGDEFAVLAPSTDEEAARALAERIRSRVAARRIATGVTVSIGVATVRPSTVPPTSDELVGAADGALYEAKRLGRDRVVVAREAGPRLT
jgi:diguanylate cyclase (GGDEF)-like protein